MGMSPVMNGKGERPNSEGIGMNNIPSFPYKPMPFDYSAPMMNNTNPYSSNQVFNSYSPMNSPKSGKDYGAKGEKTITISFLILFLFYNSCFSNKAFNFLLQ